MARKNVKEHRQKKNGYAAEAWAGRKRGTNTGDSTKQFVQRKWRRECLLQRSLQGKLTANNTAEAATLGLRTHFNADNELIKITNDYPS